MLVFEGANTCMFLPGLPPDSLTVDGDRLYWMSDTMTFINSVNKHTGLDLVSDAAGAANILLAFGDNLQPFPGKQDPLYIF